MASNQVEISLICKDLASKAFENLGSQIQGNVLNANLLSSAITTGMRLASDAVGSFTDKLKESADLQLNNASVAGTFSALTGQSFNQGAEFAGRMNEQISKLAAALPGTNAEYRAIASQITANVLPAFKDLNGVLDQKGFETGLLNITKNLGVLSTASKTTSANTALFVNRFLSGDADGRLKILEFSQNNPAFLALVDKYMKESGTKLSDYSRKGREALLEKVTEQLVTPEVIKAASGSVSGLIESLKANLFDATTGLFGLSRDLDLKRSGEQSAFTALNTSLSILIGDNGLFNTIAKTLTTLGISFGDPMIALRNSILGFNQDIVTITSFFKGLNSTNIDSAIGQFVNQIGEWTIGFLNINGLVSFASTIDWTQVFVSVGIVLANIVNTLSSVIAGVNYGELSIVIGKILIGMFLGVGQFLSNLNWITVLEGVGILLTTTFTYGLGVALAGIALSVGAIPIAIGVASLALVSIIAANWNDITSAIGFTWNTSVVPVIMGFFDNVVGLWNSLLSSVRSKWDQIVSTVTGFFDNIMNWFTDLIKKIPGLSSGSSSNSSVQPATIFDNNSPILQIPSAETKPLNNDFTFGSGITQPINQSSNSNDSSSFSIGNLNIHTQATDSKAIANDIMSAIQDAHDNFLSNRLSTTG